MVKDNEDTQKIMVNPNNDEENKFLVDDDQENAEQIPDPDEALKEEM